MPFNRIVCIKYFKYNLRVVKIPADGINFASLHCQLLGLDLIYSVYWLM